MSVIPLSRQTVPRMHGVLERPLWKYGALIARRSFYNANNDHSYHSIKVLVTHILVMLMYQIRKNEAV